MCFSKIDFGGDIALMSKVFHNWSCLESHQLWFAWFVLLIAMQVSRACKICILNGCEPSEHESTTLPDH